MLSFMDVQKASEWNGVLAYVNEHPVIAIVWVCLTLLFSVTAITSILPTEEQPREYLDISPPAAVSRKTQSIGLLIGVPILSLFSFLAFLAFSYSPSSN